MKKNLYIALCTLLTTISLSSCDEWFDVSPKTDLKAEELFTSEDGFQSALAGTYISMSDASAYGGHLAMGLMSELAQEYDVVPDGALNPADIYIYLEDVQGYHTKNRLSDAWLKAYNIIANVNNFLKWLDKNGEVAVRNPQVRRQLRAEALAIRAQLHFDLLRGWGPMNYAENKSMLAIPYRLVADGSKQALLSAEDVVAKVLEDLHAAEEMLAFEKEQKLLLSERRFRFNYYAIKALQARVYNYAGQAEEAISSAKEVISNSGLQLQVNNQNDPILFAETIVGVHLYKMRDRLSLSFSEGPKFAQQSYCSISNLNERFGVSGNLTEDMRAKSSGFLRYMDQGRAITRKYIDNDNEVIPLIRLPEMYYILCEQSPLEQSAVYLNTVRNRRGYSSANNVVFNTEADRIAALDAEYRKEFYAEGQYFFFLKRQGLATFVNTKIEQMGEAQYVFPLPDAEKEYGWTATPESSK